MHSLIFIIIFMSSNLYRLTDGDINHTATCACQQQEVTPLTIVVKYSTLSAYVEFISWEKNASGFFFIIISLILFIGIDKTVKMPFNEFYSKNYIPCSNDKSVINFSIMNTIFIKYVLMDHRSSYTNIYYLNFDEYKKYSYWN